MRNHDPQIAYWIMRLSRYTQDQITKMIKDRHPELAGFRRDREPNLRFAQLLQSGDVSEETVRKFVRAFDQGGV